MLSPFRQVIGPASANNALGSVRNTPIWLHEARYADVYYSSWLQQRQWHP